jgi:hypothetical protein
MSNPSLEEAGLPAVVTASLVLVGVVSGVFMVVFCCKLLLVVPVVVMWTVGSESCGVGYMLLALNSILPALSRIVITSMVKEGQINR